MITIENFLDFSKSKSKMALIPCDYDEQGRLIITLVRNVSKRLRILEKRKKRETLASAICNFETGHVDIIHFRKRYFSRNNQFKVFAILVDREWIVDEETKEFISTGRGKNKKIFPLQVS